MKIKVEPFLIRKGNRVAKAAIEFEQDDNFLAGFHMVGFTICEDDKKDLFVLFPASIGRRRLNPDNKNEKVFEETKPFFFLRPDNENLLDKLESLILDVYDNMTNPSLTHTK